MWGYIKNKQQMRTNTFFIKLLCLVVMFSMSCQDFLDQKPQATLTQDQVFGDLDNIDPLLLGAITNWRNTRKDRPGFIVTLGTDEAKQGIYQVTSDAQQGGLDKYNGFFAPSNTAIGGWWESRWPIISTTARIIDALKTNTQDPARRDKLVAEASFVRAAANFELVQYWGEIPVIDLPKLTEYGTARQSLTIVYDLIISDLQTAIASLPVDQSDPRYPTRGAAQALLGKVYMSALTESGYRDYTKAKEQFEAVINSGKYQLASNYADLWNPGITNPSESIYSFQFNNTYPDNNQTQWQTGSRALANVSGNCYFGGYDLLMPTEYCYKTVSDGGVWEDGDVRKGESIRYDFTYNGTQPTLPQGFGGDELDPHIRKYEDIRLDNNNSFWYSGKNIYYLRYADILLCYAECLNELGSTSQAVDIVNTQIRARAWGGSLPDDKKWSSGMSQDEFRTKIMDERMRELCFEGWRRIDLIRTGKLVDLVKDRNRWAKESNTIQAFHTRYPIPLTEIQQNEDIDEADQNAGYISQ